MINTEPINKQDVLIRLLKDGHISDEEFKVFVNEHEEPIELPTEEEIKHGIISSCPEGFDMKLWLQLHNCKDGVITLSEPIDVSTQSPKGMHPKTWAFLNKHKN